LVDRANGGSYTDTKTCNHTTHYEHTNILGGALNADNDIRTRYSEQ
jgi:hypothetical protein